MNKGTDTQAKKAISKASELSIADLSAIIRQAIKEEMAAYLENPAPGLRAGTNLIKESRASYIPEKSKDAPATAPACKSPQISRKAKKVADLSIDELEELISVTVQGILDEILGDPDEGLEIRPEIVERIKKSRRNKTSITAKEVAKRLGLKW